MFVGQSIVKQYSHDNSCLSIMSCMALGKAVYV